MSNHVPCCLASWILGVAGEAGVLDGVDAGEDGVADAVVAVGMGGDLQAEHVGLVGDRLHLVIGQLLSAGAVAQREDAAGGADLDHLGAIFVHLADLGAPSSGLSMTDGSFLS